MAAFADMSRSYESGGIMNERRNFLKLASAAALPAAAVAIGGKAHAADGDVKDLMGAWTTLHGSPFGPFREFLMLAEGGGLWETNVLLHTNSNVNFASFTTLLPDPLNASDGTGNWERIGPRQVRVTFRKLMFNHQGVYIGDFYVKGLLKLLNGDNLRADWEQIVIVDPFGQLVLDLLAAFGPVHSDGTRIK
jgi:hypothetical protein